MNCNDATTGRGQRSGVETCLHLQQAPDGEDEGSVGGVDVGDVGGELNCALRDEVLEVLEDGLVSLLVEEELFLEGELDPVGPGAEGELVPVRARVLRLDRPPQVLQQRPQVRLPRLVVAKRTAQLRRRRSRRRRRKGRPYLTHSWKTWWKSWPTG